MGWQENEIIQNFMAEEAVRSNMGDCSPKKEKRYAYIMNKRGTAE